MKNSNLILISMLSFSGTVLSIKYLNKKYKQYKVNRFIDEFLEKQKKAVEYHFINYYQINTEDFYEKDFFENALTKEEFDIFFESFLKQIRENSKKYHESIDILNNLKYFDDYASFLNCKNKVQKEALKQDLINRCKPKFFEPTIWINTGCRPISSVHSNPKSGYTFKNYIFKFNLDEVLEIAKKSNIKIEPINLPELSPFSEFNNEKFNAFRWIV